MRDIDNPPAQFVLPNSSLRMKLVIVGMCRNDVPVSEKPSGETDAV